MLVGLCEKIGEIRDGWALGYLPDRLKHGIRSASSLRKRVISLDDTLLSVSHVFACGEQAQTIHMLVSTTWLIPRDATCS